MTVAGSGSAGSSRSELYYPTAIVVKDNVTMYISDNQYCRILRWQVGEPLGTVVVNGRGCGSTFDKIGRSYALFVDSFNNIFVSEYVYHRVTMWYYGNNTASSLVIFFYF